MVRTRVIIHEHHPDESTESGNSMGKLVLLPETIEELFGLAGIMIRLSKIYFASYFLDNPRKHIRTYKPTLRTYYPKDKFLLAYSYDLIWKDLDGEIRNLSQLQGFYVFRIQLFYLSCFECQLYNRVRDQTKQTKVENLLIKNTEGLAFYTLVYLFNINIDGVC